MAADTHSYPVPGGVRNRLYEGFPWLYLQTGYGFRVRRRTRLVL